MSDLRSTCVWVSTHFRRSINNENRRSSHYYRTSQVFVLFVVWIADYRLSIVSRVNSSVYLNIGVSSQLESKFCSRQVQESASFSELIVSWPRGIRALTFVALILKVYLIFYRFSSYIWKCELPIHQCGFRMRVNNFVRILRWTRVVVFDIFVRVCSPKSSIIKCVRVARGFCSIF